MELFLRLFTIFIYVTLLYELVGIPVPSIASTYQLFFTQDELGDVDTLLARVRRWPLVFKTIGLMLPTALVVLIYLLPLLQALWPRFSSWLHPIGPAGFHAICTHWHRSGVVGKGLGSGGRLDFCTMMMGCTRLRSICRRVDSSLLRETRFLLGIYVAFAGLWLLYPSWELALGFVLFIANMHFRVLLEEDYLRSQFGLEYETFLAATRRYI